MAHRLGFYAPVTLSLSLLPPSPCLFTPAFLSLSPPFLILLCDSVFQGRVLGLSARPALGALSSRSRALRLPVDAVAEDPPFLGRWSRRGPFPPADCAVGDAAKRAAAAAASRPLRRGLRL